MLRLIALMLLASCISLKTNNQIQQDRVVEGLPKQVEQSQKLIAQMTLRMNELEGRLQNYNGDIEEIEYRQQKLIPNTQKEIDKKILDQSKELKSLRSELQKNQQEVDKLKRTVNDQKKYIQKVNSTLSKLSKTSSVNSKKTSPKKYNDFLNGVYAYKKKRYVEAKKKLLSALKNEDLNAAERNQSYQSLGHIEFSKKNYGQSNIYFSKIFTKYPKSSMAPDALLHMARAFEKQKNSGAAKEAYQTFLSEYPKHSLVNTVKRELDAL